MAQLQTRTSSREIRTPNPPVEQRSYGPWLAAAVFVAVVGIGAFVFTQFGGDNNAIPLSGAAGQPEAIQSFAAVEEAYAAYNAGDPVWVELRDRGSAYASSEAREQARAVTLRMFEAEQAADGQLEVSGCSWQGTGTWPDVADNGLPAAVGHLFTCEAIQSDSLHSAAGMQLASSYEWVVADGDIVAVISKENTLAWTSFVGQFQVWLAETHPDVAREVGFIKPYGTTVFPEAEDVPTALEYIDEFVASRR